MHWMSDCSTPLPLFALRAQGARLYLMNRGILITPFHNMMLCCPQTGREDVTRLLETLEQAGNLPA